MKTEMKKLIAQICSAYGCSEKEVIKLIEITSNMNSGANLYAFSVQRLLVISLLSFKESSNKVSTLKSRPDYHKCLST